MSYGKLLPDQLWNEIEPLFPVREMTSRGGRPLVDNRSVFLCLLFVLKTGIGWRELPTELGAGEKTVRRRLKEWSDLGLWTRIFEHRLERARVSGRLDLAEVLIDAGLVKAPCGGEKSAPTRPIVAAAAAS